MPTVREYMDSDPATVTPETKVEDVAFLLGRHELHGVPVVDAEGRCVGIVTEDDLVLADEEGDLHVPHYIELFGGLVPLGGLRERGIDAPLLVMGALTREDLALAVRAGADVVAWTTEFLEEALRLRARVHVKLDTGMGRLGTADERFALELCDRAGDALAGLM